MKNKTIAILTTLITTLLLLIFAGINIHDYVNKQQIKIDCRSNFAEKYCLQKNSELNIVYASYEFTCVDINERIANKIRYKLLRSEIEFCEAKQ